MKCKVVKSKVSNPMGECEIPCFFDRGFVSYEDLNTIRKEMMDIENKKYSKRNRNLDEWEEDEE